MNIPANPAPSAADTSAPTTPFLTESPDGKPYHHDPKKVLAAKLALVEGDGPVSDATAKAYVEAYASAPRCGLEIEAALLAADRLGPKDRNSPLAILADVVHHMRANERELLATIKCYEDQILAASHVQRLASLEEYELHYTWTGATMRKCRDGGWVNADAVRAALAAKDREIARLNELLAAEKNLHGQAQAAAYEQNETANRLSQELADLKNAGGPPFIRSEAIRNLRDQVCGLKARAEKAEAELATSVAFVARLQERQRELMKEAGELWHERDTIRAEVERLRAENQGMLNAGGYAYLSQRRDEAERRAAQYLATGEAIQKQLAAAQATAREAMGQLADTKLDKERLDWLDRLFEGYDEWVAFVFASPETVDLRAAIDAARRPQP